MPHLLSPSSIYLKFFSIKVKVKYVRGPENSDILYFLIMPEQVLTKDYDAPYEQAHDIFSVYLCI